MKIRTGFVSNSSTSSFVIRRVDSFWNKKPKILITSEQSNKLRKYGFRKTYAHCPAQLTPFYDTLAWNKENKQVQNKRNYNLGYEVIVNQDEVIEFLIKNKIPFVAECHYGHQSMIYIPENDTLYIGINFGKIMEMHGVDDINKYAIDRTGIKIYKASDYIKKLIPNEL